MTDIRLITCAGVEHDLALLPHFLTYYSELGIAPCNMHVVLQASNDNTKNMHDAVALLDKYGIQPEEVWIAAYTSQTMWEKRREIQQKVAHADDWIISADVDEFHEFPGDLTAFLAYCDKNKLDCVQGVFIDRLAPQGELSTVRQDCSIWHQFPIQADVMCTIRQHEEGHWAAGTVNVMACKGRVPLSIGGHGALAGQAPVNYFSGRHLGKVPGIGLARVRFAMPLRVHHFKWTDRLADSLKKRLATPGVSERGKMYGEALLNHIDGQGRIQVDKMPIRKPGLAERLPWRYQLQVFSLQVLANRISRKLSRMVKS